MLEPLLIERARQDLGNSAEPVPANNTNAGSGPMYVCRRNEATGVTQMGFLMAHYDSATESMPDGTLRTNGYASYTAHQVSQHLVRVVSDPGAPLETWPLSSERVDVPAPRPRESSLSSFVRSPRTGPLPRIRPLHMARPVDMTRPLDMSVRPSTHSRRPLSLRTLRTAMANGSDALRTPDSSQDEDVDTEEFFDFDEYYADSPPSVSSSPPVPKL